MTRKRITPDDYHTLALALATYINDLNGKHANFTATIEDAQELLAYFVGKVEERERLGVGWK